MGSAARGGEGDAGASVGCAVRLLTTRLCRLADVVRSIQPASLPSPVPRARPPSPAGVPPSRIADAVMAARARRIPRSLDTRMRTRDRSVHSGAPFRHLPLPLHHRAELLSPRVAVFFCWTRARTDHPVQVSRRPGVGARSLLRARSSAFVWVGLRIVCARFCCTRIAGAGAVYSVA